MRIHGVTSSIEWGHVNVRHLQQFRSMFQGMRGLEKPLLQPRAPLVQPDHREGLAPERSCADARRLLGHVVNDVRRHPVEALDAIVPGQSQLLAKLRVVAYPRRAT